MFILLLAFVIHLSLSVAMYAYSPKPIFLKPKIYDLGRDICIITLIVHASVILNGIGKLNINLTKTLLRSTKTPGKMLPEKRSKISFGPAFFRRNSM